MLMHSPGTERRDKEFLGMVLLVRFTIAQHKSS